MRERFDPTVIGDITAAKGLAPTEREQMSRLVSVWRDTLPGNRLRNDFYYMHVVVDNIGIAISPKMLSLLNASCGWPAKAVDMLAQRSVPDGFKLESGQHVPDIDRIMRDNRFYFKYPMAATSELTHSTMAWTLSRGQAGRSNVRIKSHSAETAAMLWDGGDERIECGFAIIDWEPAYRGSTYSVPSVVNLYTSEATVVLTRTRLMDTFTPWQAKYVRHPMGRPLMEPMSFAPSMTRPFGKSRISRAVMATTMSKLREDMRTELSAELNTTPQKFLLGADEEAFDMDRYEAYVGNIFITDRDEEGELPQFGQLPQVSLQPHIDYTRSLAAQFSGETSIPISSLGVIHDNPASAEAIAACERDMVQLAEGMNATNGEALRNVALMALAIDRGTGLSMDALSDEELSLMVDWHDPSMPNIAATADAWTKMAGAPGAEWIAQTEEFLEGVNVPRAKRASMLAQKRQMDGRAFVADSMEAGYGDDPQAGAATLRTGAEGQLGGGTRVRVEGAGGRGGEAGRDGGVVA